MSIMPNIKDAVYLIDDESFFFWGLRSCWDYFNDGEGPKPYRENNRFIMNSDKDGEVYLRRDCTAFSGGKMTFEMLMENLEGEGFYVAFGSRKDAFLTLYSRKDNLYVGNNKVSDFACGKHYLKVTMDMACSKALFFVDGKNCGTFDFDKPAFTYNCIRLGYGEKDKGATALYFVKLYVNYLANDGCLNKYIGPLSEEYQVKAPRGSSVTCDYRVKEKDDYTYISRNRKGAKTVTTRAFDKASGMVVLEIMYLMHESDGKVKIALCKGSKDVVSVYDEGEALHCYCGCKLRDHHKTVWQTLRIYADTDKNCATIWLNGKKTKTVDFENPAKFIDNFKVTYEAYEKSSLMFSDILVWVKPEEPEDYVPAPIVPKKKNDYIVGINVCSLWREGSHQGWDWITPYDDIKPVLGYYDEGLPETADWEIKYMVEHGIDYQLYCWFASENDAPMKITHLHHAWIDGHFYAKYGDMQKFAILWEAVNGRHPRNLDDFKNIIVPYWIDYFFSDPRYMRIDNMAVMSCFGVGIAVDNLGGEEQMREAVRYLRQEVKKLGYDDIIVMGCSAHPKDLQNLEYDAHHAYHWGSEGYRLDHNIKMNEDNTNVNGAHVIPTVSVGFKDIGWGGVRRPNMSVQDMKTALTYCTDNLLTKYDKDSWKSRTLHLSTWNEYGEGTYIMPSGLNGFGYLDAIREVVCEDEPHEDIIPTEEQKARICYLFSKDRRRLSREKYDVRQVPQQDKVIAKYTFKSQSDLKKWKFANIADLEIKDGKLCGKATENCPEMELKKFEFDATEIGYAKVVCTNYNPNMGRPYGIHFVPTNSPKKDNYNRDADSSFSAWCNTKELKEYVVQFDTKPYWTNKMYGMKFIPTTAGTFEIESITFCAPVPNITIYNQAGKQLFFGDYLTEKNGEIMIPLDPASGLLQAMGYRHDWNRDTGTLTLWNKTDSVTVVVGKAYAEKNDEIYTLVRPPYLMDGIPAVALSDLEKIYGLKYEREGNKVYIK